MATLKKLKGMKSGATRYGVEGLKGSVVVGPNLFAGEAPDTLEIAAEFASPEQQVQNRKTSAAKRPISGPLAEAREAAKKLREQARDTLRAAREKARAERDAAKNKEAVPA